MINGDDYMFHSQKKLFEMDWYQPSSCERLWTLIYLLRRELMYLQRFKSPQKVGYLVVRFYYI